MSILALIPARAGSKGLPRKNVLPLAGKPLIAWTIAAALEAGVFARVVVSTDGEEIAAAARQAGAEVPFMRPEEFASDQASTLAVGRHALRYFDEQGEQFEMVAVLQPTSPLRNADDMRGAVAKAAGRALISVCEVEHPIQWAMTIDAAGKLARHPDLLEHEGQRRQDLAKAWRPNGAIYLWPRAYIEAGVAGLPPDCLAFEMPAERSVDIDTAYDFRIVEAILGM